MFGYVTVCRECMDAADYDMFTAYYCGLCAATGEQCSQLSRLGLSYDITFLAIVLSALDKSEHDVTERRCIAHPKNKRLRVINDRAVDYAANMGVLLMYLKLLDDWKDERSLKSIPGRWALYGGMKRARRRFPEQYEGIERQLKRLGECEKNNAHVDEAADCFAKILEILFTPDFVTDETERKILAWFGYNIGRWIYVIDAYNDIEKDLDSGSYNPFLAEITDMGKDKKSIAERLSTTLTLNLDSAASAYELLRVYKNDGIIRHIVYTSLYARQKNILGENDGSVPGIGRQS